MPDNTRQKEKRTKKQWETYGGGSRSCQSDKGKVFETKSKTKLTTSPQTSSQSQDMAGEA